MTNQSLLKDNSKLKNEYLELRKLFEMYELNVIIDAVYQRRTIAKIEIEKIEEGERGPSMYEYWKEIYNECNQVYIKLINYALHYT